MKKKTELAIDVWQAALEEVETPRDDAGLTAVELKQNLGICMRRVLALLADLRKRGKLAEGSRHIHGSHGRKVVPVYRIK